MYPSVIEIFILISAASFLGHNKPTFNENVIVQNDTI